MSRDSSVNSLTSPTTKPTVRPADLPRELYNDAMFFKEEAKKLNPTPQNDMLRWRYLRASIILSFTSIEAYVNTFISDYIKNTRKLAEVADGMPTRRLSLNTKLEYIFPLVTGKRLDKTKQEWADYQTMRKIRNKLVHYDKGEAIYKDKTPLGINEANAEKGLEMVREMAKQMCALTKQKHPSWVDQTQSWIQVKIENSSSTQ
jgi:hypothetical protein